jgi:hypothetical protein
MNASEKRRIQQLRFADRHGARPGGPFSRAIDRGAEEVGDAVPAMRFEVIARHRRGLSTGLDEQRAVVECERPNRSRAPMTPGSATELTLSGFSLGERVGEVPRRRNSAASPALAVSASSSTCAASASFQRSRPAARQHRAARCAGLRATIIRRVMPRLRDRCDEGDHRGGGFLDRAARDVDHRPAIVGEHAPRIGELGACTRLVRRHKPSRPAG